MAIDAIVGIIGAIGDAVAPAAAAAEVGGAAAAADVAGAVALPEIAVTAAAPEVAAGAAGVGAGVAGGLTAADIAAGAGLAGAGAAGALAAEGGTTTIPETFGGQPAPGPSPFGADFGALGLNPAQVVQGDFASLPPSMGGTAPTPVQTTSITPGAGVPSTGGVATAGDIFGGQTGPLASLSPEDFFTQPMAGGPGFAGAPAATPGAVPGDVATALNTGAIGGLNLGETTLGTLAESPTGAAEQLAGAGIGGGGTAPAASTALEAINQAAPLDASLSSTAPAFAEPSATTATTSTLPATTASEAATPVAGLEPPTLGPGAPTPTPLEAPSTITTGFGAGESAVAGATTPNVGLPAGTSLTSATGAAAPSAGGILGTGVSAGNLLTYGAPLAALGILGYDVMRGPAPLPKATQTELGQLGPAETTAAQQLNYANAGQLTPSMQATIDQYIQQQKNQAYQLYASGGRDPNMDTDYLQTVEQIDANATAMKQAFINQMISNGLAAQGTVSSALQAAAQIQVANDNAFQSSIQSAATGLAQVAAISAIGASRKTA